jgi:hypothetical protein
MSSKLSKLSKSLAQLPEPPRENLVSYFILGEIIDHISVLQDEFPQVKIPLLKTHLWSILNKNIHPEEHLRGFLKVFEETETFVHAFSQLDDSMKKQMRVFMAGGSKDQIMAAGAHDGGFHLPASPPVVKHFKEMVDKVESAVNGLSHHHKKLAKITNGDHEVNGYAVKRVKTDDGFPQIFEDEAGTRTMEVRSTFYFTLRDALDYQRLLLKLLIVDGDIVVVYGRRCYILSLHMPRFLAIVSLNHIIYDRFSASIVLL